MINKKELRATMTLFGDRQTDLAAELGISPPTFSNKINGKTFFTTFEIEKIATRYKLTQKDIARIFFAY